MYAEQWYLGCLLVACWDLNVWGFCSLDNIGVESVLSRRGSEVSLGIVLLGPCLAIARGCWRFRAQRSEVLRA